MPQTLLARADEVIERSAASSIPLASAPLDEGATTWPLVARERLVAMPGGDRIVATQCASGEALAPERRRRARRVAGRDRASGADRDRAVAGEDASRRAVVRVDAGAALVLPACNSAAMQPVMPVIGIPMVVCAAMISSAAVVEIDAAMDKLKTVHPPTVIGRWLRSGATFPQSPGRRIRARVGPGRPQPPSRFGVTDYATVLHSSEQQKNRWILGFLHFSRLLQILRNPQVGGSALRPPSFGVSEAKVANLGRQRAARTRWAV